MQKNKTVVVLYSKGLYDLSAKAVEEYIKKTYKDCDIVTAHEGSFRSRLKVWFSRRLYVFMTRRMPSFYNFIDRIHYYFLKKNKKEKQLKIVKTSKKAKPTLATKRLRNLISRFLPEVIVCVTPKSQQLALKARKQLGLEEDVKVIALCCDFVIEKRLIDFENDGYIVQNESSKAYLQKKGVEAESITVAGLAVPEDNFREYEPDEVRADFGIKNDLPVVAVAGGRYGNGFEKKLIKRAMRLTRDKNVVIFTGENKSLKKYVAKSLKSAAAAERVYLVEKTENLAEVLSVAEFIATQPTVGVMYEAMARLVPVIAGRPCGYVEHRNFKYLLKNKDVLNGANDLAFAAAVENLVFDNRFKTNVIENMVPFTDSEGAQRIGDFLYLTALKTSDTKKKKNQESAKQD